MNQDPRMQQRKQQHIDLCARQDVESHQRRTGFDSFDFYPCAIPEMDLGDVDTSVEFLGRRFAAPILITGMTGGLEHGEMINQRLAQAAHELNIPMGVGSQRAALEDPKRAGSFAVKREFPELFLIGNIGMAQILSPGAVDLCKRAVEMIHADALAVHLNVIQELVQDEGDRQFKGVLKSLEAIVAHLGVPVMVKEVGAGLDMASARRLAEIGVAALDVGGAGGTSWPYIEGLRSASPDTLATAQVFRDWGIPTSQALVDLARMELNLALVATGGIRDGLQVAKAVALGAQMVGVGLPLLRAALEPSATGEEARTVQLLRRYLRELKITMIGTSSRTLLMLKDHLRSSSG